MGTGIARGRTAALALTAIVCAGATAAEYFVKPDGDDKAAAASKAAAWKTIQRGVRDLKPGDTLTLRPGVYDEQVVIKSSGAPGKPITLRAERPGFAILKASRRISGFRPVPGMRFVSGAKVPYKVYNVVEADTRRMLIRAPALVDMDQFRNTYFYDVKTKMLYVHCTDGLLASTHCIEGTTRHDYGMLVEKAKYIHIEGLGFQGHFIDKRSGHGFGLCMRTASHCEIRNCTFFNNAGGACFVYGCTDNVVRDCLFVGNTDPLYGELAQLYFSSKSTRCKAVNNVVLDAETHGIRFYGRAVDCTAIGNIIRKARIGLYFKATSGTRIAKNNVAVDCSYVNFGTGTNTGPMIVQNNTFQDPNWWSKNNVAKPDATNLIFRGEKAPDPKFCDPAHLDFRLQADSPYRSKGLKGAAPGAFKYTGNVYFVGPKGDDKNDGLCVARAWKTLKHACARVKAGGTVYLLPGVYNESLDPRHSGEPGRPIVFRGRGRGRRAVVRTQHRACFIRNCSWVEIEDLSIEGGWGVDVEFERNARPGPVTLRGCAIRGTNGPAVKSVNTSSLTIDGCALAAPGGSECLGGRSLRITNSVLTSGTANPALVIDAPRDGVFLDYNAYKSGGGPFVRHTARRQFADLASWRKASGQDSHSIVGGLGIADGVLAPDSPLIGAGQFGRHIGPFEVAGAKVEPTIADLKVRQVTPATACLTWWTPQTSSALYRSTSGWSVPPPELSAIRFGATKAMKQRVVSYGDLYNRVTLFDLKPDTEYFYQVELVKEGVKTKVATFRTPAANAWQLERRKLYVSSKGDGANDGLSRGTAWRTIAEASEEARAGDTIVVADGVYYETFFPVATGVKGAPIVLMSENLNGAIFDGSNCHRPSAIAIHQKAHVVVDGFVFRFYAPKVLGRRAAMDYGQVLLWGARNFTLQNCMQYGPGKYGQAAVMRWSRDVTWHNNVVMSFSGGIMGREMKSLRIVNNTFYMPLITNINMGASPFVMKNNLFYGQSEQKYKVYMMLAPRNANVDYNAYGFNANDKERYIGGYGVWLPKGNPNGLAGWRDAKAGNDKHSFEVEPKDVKFAAAPAINAYHKKFRAFWTPFRNAQKVATLALFDLAETGPLHTKGENGTHIGARSQRMPLAK